MSEQSEPSLPEELHDATLQPSLRILVALDASPHSLTALKAAAELAALMEAELQGLYVEDIDLVRLAGLPVAYEIGSYSATQRRLDSGAVERDFRLLAQQMRRAVAQTAIRARVNWSFRVTRGSVTNELLAASEAAEMLTLGRIGRTPGRRLGSTARLVLRRTMRPVFLLSDRGLTFPLTLVHTGSPAAQRATDLAVTLMQGRHDVLRLLVLVDPAHDGAERDQRGQRLVATLREQDIEVEIHLPEHTARLDALLDGERTGTVILPSELADVLETMPGSAILVP